MLAYFVRGAIESSARIAMANRFHWETLRDSMYTKQLDRNNTWSKFQRDSWDLKFYYYSQYAMDATTPEGYIVDYEQIT